MTMYAVIIPKLRLLALVVVAIAPGVSVADDDQEIKWLETAKDVLNSAQEDATRVGWIAGRAAKLKEVNRIIRDGGYAELIEYTDTARNGRPIDHTLLRPSPGWTFPDESLPSLPLPPGLSYTLREIPVKGWGNNRRPIIQGNAPEQEAQVFEIAKKIKRPVLVLFNGYLPFLALPTDKSVEAVRARTATIEAIEHQAKIAAQIPIIGQAKLRLLKTIPIPTRVPRQPPPDWYK